MKARIKYTTDFNGKEGYLIETDVGDGWDVESFFPLVRREGATGDDEKNFVHFGILNKIAMLKKWGYSIQWSL
jgi:hypothetical protein